MRSEAPRSELIDLYHGTSQEAAEAIVREGARAVATREVVARIAHEYQVDFHDVWARMQQRWGTGRENDPHVYLTTHPASAARYARRGCEVAYFARQAVYAIREGEPDRKQSQVWASDEAVKHAIPVILHVRAPTSVLREEMATRLDRLADLPGREKMAFDVAVRVPMPAEWIVATTQVAPCTCWRDGRLCSACRTSLDALTITA